MKKNKNILPILPNACKINTGNLYYIILPNLPILPFSFNFNKFQVRR
jgi:hypothetical protein